MQAHPLDLGSRAWWRLVGRPCDLTGEHAWLRAPWSAGAAVGDAWLDDAARLYGGRVLPAGPDDGLLASMHVLDGPGFSADALAPQVRAFYEDTAAWRMETWSQWQAPFAVGGALIRSLYGRRVQQLALPIEPLEVARGIESRVRRVVDAQGRHAGSAWLRSVRSTGDQLFAGLYRADTLPGRDRPSVHVTFPLEEGNVQVFLRPDALADGSLRLTSPPGQFGQDGAYVVARSFGRVFCARVPLHERFHVYVDDEGVLRTDHALDLWGMRVLRLHYKLIPNRDDGAAPPG